MSSYTEDHLVEPPAIQLMQHELGWDVMNCFGEPSSQELRRSGWEPALQRLNPDLPTGAIEGAVEELPRDIFFTEQSPEEANRTLDLLLPKLLSGG